jgi:membrane associated rhomboid family serine protease
MFIFLPVKIESDQNGGSLPVVNIALIGINLIIFILSRTTGIRGGNFVFDVLTYAFIHASLWHFIGNMWVLWVFGNKLNIRLGNCLYALIYLSATLGLGIFLRLLLRVDVVGASGCIFAVLAISLMLMSGSMISMLCVAFFPISLLLGLFSRPKHWVLWFVRWGQFKIKGLWALLIIPAFELWSLIWQGWNWTNIGHLLGLICGIVIVLMLPKRISMNASDDSMELSGI